MQRFKLVWCAVGFALTGALGEGSTGRPVLDAARVVLAPQGAAASAEISRWQERARMADAKVADFERLGWAYVEQARKTLDAGFHTMAALTADAMEQRFGASAEVWLLRGHALHNLHRFAEAEGWARRLVAERGLAWDYALLSDVLMEQGRLSAAVEACQELVNRRPGFEAYSRIAHLRWLKGDLEGATSAMEEALKVTGAHDAERRAWALTRLSGYQLQTGRFPLAERLAEEALGRLPGFAPAELAHGKALAAAGRMEEAVAALQAAERANPLPEYQWWLADGLRAAGREAEAVAVEARLVERGEATDPRTYSLYLATRGLDAERAGRLATTELDARADVFTHDAIAWTRLAEGRMAEAEEAMRRALSEGTRDARLLWHAGELARSAGRAAEAEDFFKRAGAIEWTLTPSERVLLARSRRLAPEATGLAAAH